MSSEMLKGINEEIAKHLPETSAGVLRTYLEDAKAKMAQLEELKEVHKDLQKKYSNDTEELEEKMIEQAKKASETLQKANSEAQETLAKEKAKVAVLEDYKKRVERLEEREVNQKAFEAKCMQNAAEESKQAVMDLARVVFGAQGGDE